MVKKMFGEAQEKAKGTENQVCKRKKHLNYFWRTSFRREKVVMTMKRYVKETRQRPLTNVNHLSLRPSKLFK